MFIRSIRWRIQAWHGLLLVAVVAGFGVTAWRLASAEYLRGIDEELQTRASQLALLPPDAPAGKIPRGFPTGAEGDEHYFVVWQPDGSVQTRSTNAPPDLAMPVRPSSDKPHQLLTRGTRRELTRFTAGTGRCFLVGRPIVAELAAIRRLAWLLAGAGAAVIALGLGGGWWLASRALRPVAAISDAAARIAAGNLSERIGVAETDSELGRLAGVLNSAFARLEAALARQRQFTADASHELRTPLAVQISETQTTLTRERSAAEYRHTVEVCHETAQQMRRLTESLLQLARCDDAQEAMEPVPFDLAQTAQKCCDLIRPLAAERRIRIRGDFAPAVVSGEALRLEQVVTNLLANAVQHSREAGEIHLETHARGGAVTLTIADTGTGIAVEDLPHIFERFYRADKSRARSEGRTGLGLAISKAIVEAHGGSIEASSQPGLGSTFTVRLPALALDLD